LEVLDRRLPNKVSCPGTITLNVLTLLYLFEVVIDNFLGGNIGRAIPAVSEAIATVNFIELG
jgi:hypothetical protein